MVSGRTAILALVCVVISGCGESDYIKCVDKASKSTPVFAVGVCAKRHAEKLPLSVLNVSTATWNHNDFKIKSISAEPGYAVTKVTVRLQEKDTGQVQVVEIPTFYLLGHIGSSESLSAKTSSLKPHYGARPPSEWEWRVTEVWGVNTLK
jgi:hypothetical protein